MVPARTPLLLSILLVSAAATLAQTAPVVSLNGVVNAADYSREISPGTMISIYGQGFSSRTVTASQVPLPLDLDGTSVEVTAASQPVVKAPLYFVSPGQINFQLPFGLTLGNVQLRVRAASGLSAPVTVGIVARSPKLFTKTQDGKGEPILLHSRDYTYVSQSLPAAPSEYLVLLLTGLGTVDPPTAAGNPGGDNARLGPVNQVTEPVTVSVGGRSIPTVFAGLMPGYAGVYQVNFQLPADLSGGLQPLVVQVGSASSQGGVSFFVAGSVLSQPSPPTDLGGGVRMEFVPIPSGQFLMGCSIGDANCSANEKPQHPVRITQGFDLGKFEVTQEQWTAIMGNLKAGDKTPVTYVNNDEIQVFFDKLNARKDGYIYGLPTEAQWEYAARAGTTEPLYGNLSEIAWTYGNSSIRAQPVGLKKPNAWGLYDMIGNAWEWVRDEYDPAYYQYSADADPQGADPWDLITVNDYVVRGGSYANNEKTDASILRVSFRGYQWIDSRAYQLGFRCLRIRADQRHTLNVQKTVGGELVVGSSEDNLRSRFNDSNTTSFATGFKCAGGCTQTSGTFREGSTIIISAGPVSQFVSWGGDCSGSNQVCRLTADKPHAVTAIFNSSAAPPGALSADLGSGLRMDFAAIPAGEFMMGCSSGDRFCSDNEKPLHKVTITKPFEMGIYEVTQEQFRSVLGSTAGYFPASDPRLPADRTRKNEEIRPFLNTLNARSDGYTYRLPTEAEWEYAARAGSTDPDYGPLDEIAWYGLTAGDLQHVGLKKPNAWGLYDMIGNAWEVVQDPTRAGNPAAYPDKPVADPIGTGGEYTVVRGGCAWNFDQRVLRASFRSTEFSAGQTMGFRVVRTPK